MLTFPESTTTVGRHPWKHTGSTPFGPFIGVGGAIVTSSPLPPRLALRDPCGWRGSACPLVLGAGGQPVLGTTIRSKEVIARSAFHSPDCPFPCPLPGGEHLSHVVRRTAASLDATSSSVSAFRLPCRRTLTAGASRSVPTTPAYGAASSCLFRCPSGSLTPCVRGPYSGKIVGAAFAAGALTHVLLLFIGYGFFKNGVIGSAGLLVS